MKCEVTREDVLSMISEAAGELGLCANMILCHIRNGSREGGEREYLTRRDRAAARVSTLYHILTEMESEEKTDG